ncbi:MAG: carbon-nitrogen hydrolase family protein [Colwellia sp.]
MTTVQAKKKPSETFSKKVFLSAIQMTSVVDVDKNLETVSAYLKKITTAHQGSHLVVLPECCLFFGGSDRQQLELAQKNGQVSIDDNGQLKSTHNRLVNALSALAKAYRVYLLAGTIPIINETADKFTNSSLLFSPEGYVETRYDKIHLFDVDVSPQTKSEHAHNKTEHVYRESKYTQAGSAAKVTALPFAQLGLTVCFDLRFPHLFNALTQAGSEIITVPSAFTRVTGKVHWQTLLSARAIENQVYIIAAGQEGIHENGRETWGHSMIIDPWGEILACLEHGEGYITVPFDANELERIRQSIPLNHVPFEN